MKLLWPSGGGYSVRLNKSVQTNDLEANLPLDEQMDDFERRRLLYVAATRTRDHLVVSLHRGNGAQTNARLLADSGAIAAAGAVTFGSAAGAVSVGPRVSAVTAPPGWEEWHPALLAVRDAARRASSISASGLEGTEPDVHYVLDRAQPETGLPATTSAASVVEPPGAAKGPRDVELPPWSKGRYGTAVGRAVHGVLQAIDLATGEGLDQVAAQCVAEGVVAYTDIVRGCVQSALESDVVRRAATREHWRESFVGNVLDDGICCTHGGW